MCYLEHTKQLFIWHLSLTFISSVNPTPRRSYHNLYHTLKSTTNGSVFPTRVLAQTCAQAALLTVGFFFFFWTHLQHVDPGQGSDPNHSSDKAKALITKPPGNSCSLNWHVSSLASKYWGIELSHQSSGALWEVNSNNGQTLREQSIFNRWIKWWYCFSEYDQCDNTDFPMTVLRWPHYFISKKKYFWVFTLISLKTSINNHI